MSFTLRAAIVIALSVSSALGSADIPDEWFYNGANRPEALKSLEGKPAPALSTETWIGDKSLLKNLKGKVVIVDFWATWCGPCIAAIPENIELVSELTSKGLVFIGVHDANAGWDRAAGIVKDKGINYSVAKDLGGESATAYKLQFWPTYVAIDRKGIVRAAGLMPHHVADVAKLLLAEDAPESDETGGFGPEVYLGGSNRPGPMRALEGKPAPTIDGETWLGTPRSSSLLQGSVIVVHFTNPGSAISRKQLKAFAEIETEFANRGVSFIGICDANAPWDRMEDIAEAAKVTMPFLQDVAVPESDEAPDESENPSAAKTKGALAKGFAIQYFPATVIVDRDGVVRAAGVRTDKVGEIVEALLAE